MSRRYVHKIPFIVKLNHNDFLNYPNTYDQIMFGSARPGVRPRGGRAWAPPSTSARRTPTARSRRCRRPSPRPTGWACSPCCGATCGTRRSSKDDIDYHLSADLTGQANHLGVTIEADIIKQKQPENNGGYNAIGFGKTDPLVYDELTTDHPIDLTRWQVVNCYAGRIPLINSGGESKGADDLAQAVRTAVINKRAGGPGSSWAARPSSGRPTRVPPSSMPSRTSIWTRGHHRLTSRTAPWSSGLSQAPNQAEAWRDRLASRAGRC